MTSVKRWLGVGLLCGVLGGVAAVMGMGESDIPPEEAPLLRALHAAPVERVRTHVLEHGEALGVLLSREGLTGPEMRSLLLAAREHMNPRRVRAGAEVTVRRWARDDSVRAVELAVNADSTVRLEKEPLGWTADVRVTPTAVDTVYAAGVIEEGGSLWISLVWNDELDAATRYAVAAALRDVYAFKIDFYHDLRAEDAYRFAYEREIRPDRTLRRGRILSAEILNRGDRFTAVYFQTPDGGHEYYDLEGKSVRGAFRRYPLDHVRVTSSFAWRRYHPVLGRYRAHLGMDFGANYGTPVLAAGGGTVARARPNGGYGNFIELRHPAGYSTRYAHLSRIGRGIRPGRRVEQSQVIGYVGASGLATGPHLHYEFRRDGRPVNPRTVELPGGPPVPDSLRPEFEEVAARRIALLDRVRLPGATFATDPDEADAAPAEAR